MHAAPWFFNLIFRENTTDMKRSRAQCDPLVLMCLAILFCFPAFLNGQTLKLKTQAEVDNYPFGNYWPGTLIIGPDACCSDIHDLSNLSSIEEIGYKLIIQNNPHLQSLHGLEQFQYMEGNRLIEIVNNDSLLNLQGMSFYISGPYPLTDIILFIRDNDRLANFSGIPFLDKPTIDIQNCPSLVDLSGMEGFHFLEMQVHECANLQSFHGMENVDTLWGSFIVRNCPRLKNMQGLDNLQYFGSIKLDRLDSLKNTDGLEKIRSIPFFGSIEIDTCPQLTALTGFDSMSGWFDNMAFVNCPRLNDFPLFSDSTGASTLYYVGGDSLDFVSGLNRLRANQIDISGNAKKLTSLPRGVNHPGTGKLPDIDIRGPMLTSIESSSAGQQPEWGTVMVWYCPKLKEINAFGFLEKVRSLAIAENTSLVEIHDFNALDQAGAVSIFENPTLSSIYGFQNMNTVGYILLSYNMLSNISGFRNLHFANALHLTIEPFLTDLSPLEDSIRQIGVSLIIDQLNGLDSITGFNGVKTMGTGEFTPGLISILRNSSLKAITGFQSVDSLKYGDGDPNMGNTFSFNIQDNPVLKTITGFKNLDYVRDFFRLSGNDSLSDASGFCHLFKEGTLLEPVTIENNATGANTLTEITSSCDSVTDVALEEQLEKLPFIAYPNPSSGQLFVDLNPDNRCAYISVCDMAGKEVLRTILKNGQDGCEINLGSTLKGMFFVRANGSSKPYTPLKIVVQ